MEMESWNEEAWWPLNFPVTSWVTQSESLCKQVYESSILYHTEPQAWAMVDMLIIPQFLWVGSPGVAHMGRPL